MTKITSLEFTVSIFGVAKLDKERNLLSELCLQEKLENINYFSSLKLLENYQLIFLAYYFAKQKHFLLLYKFKTSTCSTVPVNL